VHWFFLVFLQFQYCPNQREHSSTINCLQLKSGNIILLMLVTLAIDFWYLAEDLTQKLMFENVLFFIRYIFFLNFHAL